MIRLNTTTRKLQAILAGAVANNQLPVTVCYSDKSASSYAGATQLAATNGVTAVDICAAPAAATVRDIDMIAVVNTDTAAATVTIRIDDAGTPRQVFAATLTVGDQINYTHGSGWQVLDSTGAAKGAGAASASSANTNYSQAFPANTWGGKTHSFTVPAGVSKLKATAVAAGGCLGGAGSMGSLDSGGNNLIFARTNGIDPFFMVTATPSTSYMNLNILGTQVTGVVINSAIAGVNGAGDMSVYGRMHGNYFNAADTVPWGISVSQSGSTNASLIISSTTDGFNYTHAKYGAGLTSPPSTSFWIASVVFGGDGEAIVVPGSSNYFYHTSNYGATWTTIVNSTAIASTQGYRLRYLNGIWVMLTTNTSFYYTTAPTAGAWTGKALGERLYDIGWTGTTYVGAYANSTNVYRCATLGGTWVTQPHGGNRSFDVVESGNGEVLLLCSSDACVSAASMCASSGGATTWVPVSPFSAGVTYYDAAKYIPFASGGRWVIGLDSGTTMYSRPSLLSGAATAFTTGTTITGNALSNGTAINNIQWCGGDYVHLGHSNGLGKYSAAGGITTSLQTSAQLTAEFGFSASTTRSSGLTITRGGATLLHLHGGGAGGTNAGAGGGNGYPSPGTGRGNGPGGSGGLSAPTAGFSQMPSGNAGFGALTANGAVANGGGGVPNLMGGIGITPLPNTKVPGASGGGSLFSTSNGCGGGGGSLFAPAGNGYVAGSSGYADPATVFNASSRIGSPGGGAHGAWVGSTTCYSAGGGGEGCYRYEIDVTPGDVLTINVPGVAYVYASANATSGAPGGEGFCMFEWEV